MAKYCVVVVLMGALVGCADRTPRPPKVDDPENQAILAQLQPYIDCLEKHSKPVFELANLYRELMRAQPSAATLVIRATPDPESCVAAIQAAKLRAPQIADVETAGAAFADTLANVHQLSKAAETPADATVRTKLVAALDEFDRVQGTLFDVVRRLNHTVHRDQLARREQSGDRTLAIRIESVLLDAETLIGGAVTTWDRLDSLDVTVLAQQVLALESAAQDMSARAIAEPKEVTAFDGFYSFELHLKLFIVACKQLIQRAHDRVAYSDAEKLMIAANNEANVIGSPASVTAAFNQLVDIYGVR